MSAQGSSPQRVIILGGGYAGLSAAYALTQAPGWQQRFEVTIYQIGWRLGGKAASGRNPEFYGRNEARGPHLWMGGYHHAFALLDGCYRELGRQPPAPLPGWHEVVRPLHELYLGGRLGGGTGQMLPLPLRAGQPGGLHQPASIWACLVRMLRWVVQSLCTLNNHTYLVDWVATWPEARRRRLYASIRRAARYGVHEYRKRPPAGQDRLTCGFTAATAPLRETSLPGNPATVRVWVAPLLLFADYGLAALGAEGKTTPLHGIVELAATIARGLVEDRMYLRREFHNLRDIDFREWLHRNRARPQLLDHPALLGLYDLFLAYKNGDTRTPSLAASAALECITRGLCDGRGSLLYQFQSGPGEVVFAPLYEVLKRRGVKFRFFHRVKDIAANASGHGISQVTLGQQVLLHRPEDGYQPLFTVKGVPCWPSFPDYSQIVLGHEPLVQQIDFESQTSPEVGEIVLAQGTDFDHVICALPGNLLTKIAPDLLERSPALTAMTKHLATTASEGAQLWLDTPWSELRGQVSRTDSLCGVGLPQPLTHFELRTHQIDREQWPAERNPSEALAFAGPLPASFLDNLPNDHDPQKRQVLAGEHIRNHTIRWMQIHCTKLWPAPSETDGPPWARLVDPHERTGPRRLDAQFLWANIADADRYVQSLPKTEHFRPHPSASGFDHLTLAGDWTDAGLNLGCAETAIVSGLVAASTLGCDPPIWERELPTHTSRNLRALRDPTLRLRRRS